MKIGQLAIAAALAFSFVVAGCTKVSENGYDTSSAEVMGETIGGAANATDNSGSVVALNPSAGSQSNWAQTFKKAAQSLIESSAQATTSCYNAASAEIIAGGGSGCSSNVITLTLGGCNGFLGTWSGTDVLTFSAGACSTANTSGLGMLTNGESVVMTSTTGLTLTTYGGYMVETDSNSSGYSVAESGGITMLCTGATCGAARTVTINGLHRRLTNPMGVTLFDHTLSTPTGFTFTGSGASKVISSGTFQLEHNLAKFIATSTVTSNITFSNNCCLPTGGTMTTTFSGSKTGTETVAFGPTCGVGSVNGNSVVLGYCQ